MLHYINFTSLDEMMNSMRRTLAASPLYFCRAAKPFTHPYVLGSKISSNNKNQMYKNRDSILLNNYLWCVQLGEDSTIHWRKIPSGCWFKYYSWKIGERLKVWGLMPKSIKTVFQRTLLKWLLIGKIYSLFISERQNNSCVSSCWWCKYSGLHFPCDQPTLNC